MKRICAALVAIVLMYYIRIRAIQSVLEMDLNTKQTLVWTSNISSTFSFVAISLLVTFIFAWHFEGLRKVLHDIRDALNANIGTTQVSYRKIDSIDKDMAILVDRKAKSLEIKPNVEKKYGI